LKAERIEVKDNVTDIIRFSARRRSKTYHLYIPRTGIYNNGNDGAVSGQICECCWIAADRPCSLCCSVAAIREGNDMGYGYYGRDRKEKGDRQHSKSVVDIFMIDEGVGTQKNECSHGKSCFVLV
jgi:hypothetical protein